MTADEEPKRGRGRPATGKKSNPEWEQLNVYIRRDTKRRLNVKLAELGKLRQTSDLVDALLVHWLNNPHWLSDE